MDDRRDEVKISRLNTVGTVVIEEQRRAVAGIQRDRIQIEQDVRVSELGRIVLRGTCVSSAALIPSAFALELVKRIWSDIVNGLPVSSGSV